MIGAVVPKVERFQVRAIDDLQRIGLGKEVNLRLIRRYLRLRKDGKMFKFRERVECPSDSFVIDLTSVQIESLQPFHRLKSFPLSELRPRV